MTLTATIQEKLVRLHSLLREYGCFALAFSGGVDSAFLLREAAETLGPGNILAITVQAVNFPAGERGEAEAFARRLGVRQLLIPWDVLSLPAFVENGPERCYYCKRELLGLVADAARDYGMVVLADGGNVDDLGDYRPGLRAVRECGVVSPLAEAGFGKGEIRACLREAGISLWEKPAAACLASRVPYGMEITGELLERIERGEEFLRGLNLGQVRLRHHGDVARIEVPAGERKRFGDEALCDRVAEAFENLGYKYVTFDLRGYRMGSMNAVLPDDKQT